MQFCDPTRIRHVSLSARYVLHVGRLTKCNLDPHWSPGIVDRLPIYTSGLHGHIQNVHLLELQSGLDQILSKRYIIESPDIHKLEFGA